MAKGYDPCPLMMAGASCTCGAREQDTESRRVRRAIEAVTV